MNKANECTCPSGDGSLVHPCPAHPAVEQAGGDERAKFEYWASDEGIYPKAVERSGNCYKLAQTQSYWMAWQARAALAQPSQSQYEASFEEWLANELEGEDGQPVPAAVCDIAIARRAFNHWPKLEQPAKVGGVRFSAGVSSRLVVEAAQRLYEFESTPEKEAERPEVAEVAFVLRNIGAMDAEDIDGDNVDLRFEDAEGRDTGCDVSIVEYAEKAADLFEQHDRIVGELRADRDSWAEQAEQRLADWDEMRKERDAALVEVERLSESKGDPVGSFEKCMKVMYERDENAKRLEVALARVAELEGKLTDWVHEGFRLNEALAVAKAQHSVPDDDMILQIFADNAEHSEQGDEHGYCIVREQHAQAIARKLLAAAPGNSAQHSVPEGWKLVPIEPLLNMMSDKDHDTRITAERQLLSILADVPGNSVPQAWIDVQAERRRQITAEGWTPEHDDLYCAAELPRAAAAYILNGANDEAPAIWPFVTKWWKPRDARSNYVRAGALILAEIERLDRARQGGRS